MWSFNTTIGKLFHDSVAVADGYSGFAEGKNNPLFEDEHDVGPIPRGKYTMEPIKDKNGKLIDYENKRAPVIRLIPDPSNDMFGRSGFLIHGDSILSPGTASLGCVIEAHDVRTAIVASGDTEFEVF